MYLHLRTSYCKYAGCVVCTIYMKSNRQPAQTSTRKTICTFYPTNFPHTVFQRTKHPKMYALLETKTPLSPVSKKGALKRIIIIYRIRHSVYPYFHVHMCISTKFRSFACLQSEESNGRSIRFHRLKVNRLVPPRSK